MIVPAQAGKNNVIQYRDEAMPTIDLQICPPEAIPIGNTHFTVHFADDAFTYLSNLVPFDAHPSDDRAAMLLRIGRLARSARSRLTT